MHGDRALDEQFQAVLREAVKRGVTEQSAIFALDPVYAAAGGGGSGDGETDVLDL